LTRLIPPDVRVRLIARVGAEAEAADWEHLTQADKSSMIARWVTSPAVGDVLRPLLGTDAEVRLWIKEVAIKRHARSLLPGADDVVAAALGDAAGVVPGSVGIKPAHCLARADGGTWYVCWDRAANAKHLVWAALQAADADRGLAGVLVAFVEGVTDQTPDGPRSRIERIASKGGVEVRWIDP
jgi:hypothetical protein